MTDTIRNLDIAIEGVGDKASLDAFINDLRTLETQLGRVKAESKQLEQINKFNFYQMVELKTTMQLRLQS